MEPVVRNRRIFLDMHFPDWPDNQTATAFDPAAIAQALSKAEVDSVVLFAKCQFGNFYSSVKSGHKHSGLGELELYSELQRYCHEKGIKVFAYYSVCWDEAAAAAHPEWLVMGRDGSLASDNEFRWETLCINSPYRKLVLEQLEELASVFRPDGFWIDMTIIGRNRCFCPHCSKKFENVYGIPLPEHIGPGTPEGAKFIEFRYNYIEEFYKEAYSLIRRILPDSVNANNYWGYPYSWDTMGSRAIGSLSNADYVTGEAYTDWTGLSAPGFFSRWLRSAAGGRPYEALIGRFTGTWDYTCKPAAQLAAECYGAAANGAMVVIDDEPFADGSIDKELYRDIGSIYSEIEHRGELIGGDFLKHVAIFHSQATKDYYLNNNERFITTIAGAYRLMRECRYPAEFVFDENVTPEKLAEYRAIILPTVAVISGMQFRMLLEYARQGGLVFAAGETALYEAKDYRLVESNALKLLDMDFDGMSKYTVTYFSLKNGTYSKGLSKRPVLVRNRYAKLHCNNADNVFGYAVDPICETTGDTFFHNNLPAPFRTTGYPALISIPYGKGRIVLFAQDIFSQFARYHQPELKTLASNILEQHAGTPEVICSASSNVEVIPSVKDGRLLVNLVSYNPGMGVCCGTMDTFEARYPRTFEFIDQVDALADVEVTVNMDSIKACRAYTTGKELQLVKRPGGFSVTLARLYQWETLVFELKK